MSADFEWRFGDELPDEQSEKNRYSRLGWRRWLPWLLVLLLAAGGVFVWWRERQQTLAEAEAQVEQVARLELRALAEGDGELFLSLQDFMDRSWKEAQATYVDTGGLPLPLQGLTTPISTSVESARIVGGRAEVEVIHTAKLPSGEEASFRAVRFYRYSSDRRWLHTKMEPDYGGHTVIFTSDDLEIQVFAEDSIPVRPVAGRLAALPRRFCRLVRCQHSLVGVSIASDVDEARSMAKMIGLDTTLSLSLAANLEEAAEQDDAVLPASFLVGSPANPAAQAAWEESLSQFLVDYLITREIGPREPDDQRGALFEERLRLWLKHKLGVAERPPLNLDLIRDAMEDDAWIPTWHLWLVGPDDPERALAAAQIDLLLAFIEEERGPSAVADLVGAFQEAGRIGELLDHVDGWADLEDSFRGYLRERTTPTIDDLAAFARYDLVIGCSEATQSLDVAELWAWRVGRTEPVLLSARLPDDGLGPISWSPDGTQLLLLTQFGVGEELGLLRAGSDAIEPIGAPDGARPVSTWLGQLGRSGWSHDGTHLAYYIPDWSHDPSRSVDKKTAIVNLSSGETVTLDGHFVAWSPSSLEVLYAKALSPDDESNSRLSEPAVRDFLVAEKDGTGPQWVGRGYTAAWSPDGTQIAVVDSAEALTAYDLTSGERTTWLDRDTLRETTGITPTFFAASDQAFRLAWSPNSDSVLLSVTKHHHGGTSASALILAWSDHHRLLHGGPGSIPDLAWAHHGRWLSAFFFDGERAWSGVFERDGSLVLREERTVITWPHHGHYAALTQLEEEGTKLQILDFETERRQTIDVPGRCWLPIWNPSALQQDCGP
jgi:hypothetical protein